MIYLIKFAYILSVTHTLTLFWIIGRRNDFIISSIITVFSIFTKFDNIKHYILDAYFIVTKKLNFYYFQYEMI
jgi:hypothetical protein